MNWTKILWTSIALFFNSSCISIPDFEACGNLTEGRGFCTKVLSHKERIINKDDWWRLKRKSVILPAEDYGKLKSYVIKQCRRNENCVKKHKVQIDGTFKTLDKAVN